MSDHSEIIVQLEAERVLVRERLTAIETALRALRALSGEQRRAPRKYQRAESHVAWNSPEGQQRAADMYARWLAGESYRSIGRSYGITGQGAFLIVRRVRAEEAEREAMQQAVTP